MKKIDNTIDRTLKRFAVMTIIFLYKGVRDAQGRGCAEWGDLIADYIGFLIGII